MSASWKKIEDLDLITVNAKFKSRKSWWWFFWNDAAGIESEYRQFLYLVASNPGEMVVPWSQNVDDFWHEHILDTRKYEKDCQEIFGKILHHNPQLTAGSDKHQTAFEKTKQMYKAAFGDKAKNRKKNGTTTGDDAGCGASFPVVFCASASCSSAACGGGSSCSSCGSSCGTSCSSCSSCGGGCGGD